MNDKEKIKKDLFTNSQPWILSGKTSPKEGDHADDRYRLGDYKAFLVGSEDVSEFAWIQKKFPGSLIEIFYSRIQASGLAKDKENWAKRSALWDEIILEKLNSSSKFQGISVSLRIGDVMPWRTTMFKEEPPNSNNMYHKPKGFHKIYVSPEEYGDKFKRIIDFEGVRPVRLLAGVYLDLGLEYTQEVDHEMEKQYAYIEAVSNIIKKLGCEVSVDAGHPDEDYIKLINTEVLVLSRGSFSKQSGQACKKYGGRVHGTFRIDPNGVKGFCEPSTLPTDNDTEKREDLSNTYWLNI